MIASSAVSDPAGNEPHDFDLLTAWQGGSADAAELLSRRYYASIRRFFDLRAPAFADDLTQQTFLGAVEARDAFRRDASFKTFVFAIAHRQLLRHLRDAERGPRFRRFNVDPGPATSLSVVAVRQQEHRLLLMALSQLPVDLQIVTELYYWENMRTAAIGEVLGVGQSTVTSRLARARELLSQHISAMSRPGPLRESLLADLDGWSRALGPVTAAANAIKRSP